MVWPDFGPETWYTSNGLAAEPGASPDFGVCAAMAADTQANAPTASITRRVAIICPTSHPFPQ